MRLRKLKNKILIFVSLTCALAILCFALARVIFTNKHYSNIKSICNGTQISPSLVLAIIKTESSFDKDKISHKGAIGLMQIMPETANYVSQLYFSGEKFDLTNEKQNVLIGVTYLIYLNNKFEDKKTALAAYNAGEGRVYEWLENLDYSANGKTIDSIPFEETSLYVKKVLKRERIYNLLY